MEPPGRIAGRVEIQRPTNERARPSVADIGEDRRSPPAAPSPSVVYLLEAPAGTTEAAGERSVLDQRNETFVPHVLPVAVGTTVDFPNHDDLYHNVFSLSKARRFDLGRYPKGETESVRFDRAGVVRVFCEIHSHMNAFIVVLPHSFFAVTDEDGRYSIDAVPAGTYDVVWWRDGRTNVTRGVQVRAASTTTVDFGDEAR